MRSQLGLYNCKTSAFELIRAKKNNEISKHLSDRCDI